MSDEKKEVPTLAETAYKINYSLMNIKTALERIADHLEKKE